MIDDTSKTANRILKLLLDHSTKNYDPQWVNFADLLKELEIGSEKKPQKSQLTSYI